MSALPAYLISPDQLPRDCVVVRKHNVVYLRPKSKTYGHRLVQYRNGHRVGVRHQYAWPRATIVPGFAVAVSRGVTVTPGSQSFTTPGSTSWIAVAFNTLTADVKGAGGGSLGVAQSGHKHSVAVSGASGNPSSFNGSVVGNGGGGAQTNGSILVGGTNGSPGTASGGDTNTTGGGAAGGPGSRVPGVVGGAGGRAVKAYTNSSLTGSIPVVVGAGGAAGSGNQGTGSPGSNGSVALTWS